MCVYLYIHNKYTQYTHIYSVNKTFILDAINHLTVLIYIYVIFIFILNVIFIDMKIIRLIFTIIIIIII